MAHETLSRLKQIQQKAAAFLDERDLQAEEQARASRLKKFARFWVLVGRSFGRNRCPVRASALAYATLLALIPMLAVVLSVTTSILKSKGEEPIRRFVEHMVTQLAPYATGEIDPTDEKAVQARALATAKREEAVRAINEFIHKTQSGALGVTGTIALVAVAITMLVRIENTFNDIWGVTRSRVWYVQVVLYWTAITLVPILVITALGLTSGPHLEGTKRFLMAMPFLGNLIFKILPLLVLSLTFAMVYLLIPNTRVQWKAALAGGVVAGTLWHVNNLLSVHFASRLTTNNAIYGSLGMVPVFMVGLYLCWMILLFGAQVAYAFQNREAYLAERQTDAVNQRGREFVALRIMALLARRFQNGEKPLGVNQLANILGVPSKLTSQVLGTLLQAHLAVEVLDRENGFFPARPLEQVTVADVLAALRSAQGQEPTTAGDPLRARVRTELERVLEAERAAGSTTLAELGRNPPPA